MRLIIPLKQEILNRGAVGVLLFGFVSSDDCEMFSSFLLEQKSTFIPLLFTFLFFFSLVSELPTADRNSVIWDTLINMYTANIHSFLNFSAEGTFPVSFYDFKESKDCGNKNFYETSCAMMEKQKSWTNSQAARWTDRVLLRIIHLSSVQLPFQIVFLFLWHL